MRKDEKADQGAQVTARMPGAHGGWVSGCQRVRPGLSAGPGWQARKVGLHITLGWCAFVTKSAPPEERSCEFTGKIDGCGVQNPEGLL